mmetsp:Transcript_45935/g.51219  ORF Transcript_45935/g.51219 Transcript_45935/m.51219 type:complete len:96 (-) Transcript_45935:19-306(-)
MLHQSSSSPHENKASVRFNDQVEIVQQQGGTRSRQSCSQIQMIPSELFTTLPTIGENDNTNDRRRRRSNSTVIRSSSNDSKISILESALSILSKK